MAIYEGRAPQFHTELGEKNTSAAECNPAHATGNAIECRVACSMGLGRRLRERSGECPGSVPGECPGSVPGKCPGSVPGECPGSVPGDFFVVFYFSDYEGK